MHAVAQPVAARDPRLAARRGRADATLVGAVAGLCALVLYAATCARGVEWQDPGIHQYRIVTGQLEHPLGLALSHPLHYWLGRAALTVPPGDPILKLNLMSGLFGALGVGVLAGLVVRLTQSPWAGALAAATLALAHAYWQMSAVTESYTLAAALMIIEWALLLRYVRTQQPVWLIAVFACNGLHVADHPLGLLTLATYGVLLLERMTRQRVAPLWLPVAIGVWVVTASPYWSLALCHFQRTGDLAGTVHSALFGGVAGGGGWKDNVLNVHVSAAQLKLATMTFGYCFPSAAGLVALLGLLRRAHGRRRIFRSVLLAQTVIIFVFVGRYTIVDLYTYFVPICALTALWCGLGVSWLLRRWRSEEVQRWLVVLLTASALLPLPVYFIFPRVAQERGWMRARLRDIPYRNEYSHFFRPWRFLDDSAAVMARDALRQAGENGWVLADSTTAHPVAVTCLIYGGPPGARVYWRQACLTERERPPLTDTELLTQLELGGRVVAVPSPEIQRLVSPPLFIEKSEPFWQIRITTSNAEPAPTP